MKIFTRITLVSLILLFCTQAMALVVTFHYDKFSTKLYGRVSENIKQECCDSEGKTYGYKTIDVYASGEGNSKCETTVKIMAKRTAEPDSAAVDLISFLQQYAETQMAGRKKAGTHKVFFTVTNDGKETSKAYMVRWTLHKDGGATIIVTDQL